jgi:hypothetical protein
MFVRNDNCRPKRVNLKAVSAFDDDLSPAITILLPDED